MVNILWHMICRQEKTHSCLAAVAAPLQYCLYALAAQALMQLHSVKACSRLERLHRKNAAGGSESYPVEV